jgi:putative transposase
VGYPLRDERPGTVHHVGTRGNNGRPIVSDDGSCVLFLLRLAAVARRHDWTLISYCLMDNHYHLILKLGAFGMSRGVQELNGGYAIAYNMRYGRRDHLFGRRFWNREIVGDRDLLETARYVDLNPCRKSLAQRPEDWRWSGYRGTAGLASVERFHQPTELWQLFDQSPRLAMADYERFVDELPIETRPVSDTGFRVAARSVCTRGRCRLPGA